MTADYERHGRSYAVHRRADARIAARIHAALGGARTVLNVGAGAGSYEPRDRYLLAVEPSAGMREQRPQGAAPCIDARAEALPRDTDCFDATMACVTIHHWQPREAGLAELPRVARGPVVIFTFDLRELPAWQLELMGEAVAAEQPRFGTPEEVAAALGGNTTSSASRHRPTAPTASSKPSGTGRSSCSTTPSARRSRCGACCQTASSSAS